MDATFWPKVDVRGPDDCWPWKHGLDSSGYGRFQSGGLRRPAHAWAFFLTHGRWPEPCCCHRCDNPPCCNPACLFEGSNQDNVADRHAKGRSSGAAGESNRHAKLTPRAVLRIRRITGRTRQLARRYGVSISTICRARRGDTWLQLEAQ